jgi:NAD(P)-dependent dehydrogenase (short-subunit alcohol dehydrogenase family)
MRFANRTAIVTGAASGIGKAIAERLLQEGCKVIANDLNPIGISLCEEWRHQGYDVHFYLLDVSKIDELPRLAEFAKDTYGKLDILVNNAGIETVRSVYNMTLEDWRHIQSVNLESVFFLSQAAARLMSVEGYGRIVNMASIQGQFSAMHNSHYAASKAAIMQLTRSFGLELADDGILVNAIAPGIIHTPMVILSGEDETETEAFKHIYLKQGKIPLRRPGQAEEVASAALYFASEDCRYVTGQTLNVDGGLSITW